MASIRVLAKGSSSEQQFHDFKLLCGQWSETSFDIHVNRQPVSHDLDGLFVIFLTRIVVSLFPPYVVQS
jgi:hypothetical protein